MLRVWIDAGVTLSGVDNPHTKPLTFWERLLGEIASTHPEVIFLSEAFTRPAMMHTLAKIGFHQSYKDTYFTWRQSATEMAEYPEEPRGRGVAFYMRPNFWPTTHDILTPDMCSEAAPRIGACAPRLPRPPRRRTGSTRLRVRRVDPPPRRRGTDRQREVRVQAARLVQG